MFMLNKLSWPSIILVIILLVPIKNADSIEFLEMRFVDPLVDNPEIVELHNEYKNRHCFSLISTPNKQNRKKRSENHKRCKEVEKQLKKHQVLTKHRLVTP